ncbi:unnamed protein product [Gordionus sp. m RMFG-2023]
MKLCWNSQKNTQTLPICIYLPKIWRSSLDKLDDINHLGDSDKINLKSVDKAISKIFDMEGLIGEKS